MRQPFEPPTLQGKVLIAVDEDNKIYKVDAESGKLISPKSPFQYPMAK
jgi:hypothetical protein